MDIVWIDGGLGNQMFQYALALKLNDLGREVKLDITKYAEHHAHNDFELDHIFGLLCELASVREIKRLGYRKANHLTEFLKKTSLCKKTIYNYESYEYDAKVLGLDGYYIEGYWQSEKYFIDIQEKIREAYRFPEITDQKQKETVAQIKNNCSVSVHVRRGDYLRYPIYRDICTIEYYERAMEYFRDKFGGEVRFFIFTNDMPWSKEHFRSKDCCFVEGNTGTESFRDMQMMSLCRHHIIANSSFSWWGAWLNDRKDKLVIAPERWVNIPEEEQRDIIPETWIRMKG